MCSPQDLPFLNPACSLRSIGSRAVEILFRITLLNTLLVMDNSVIHLQVGGSMLTSRSSSLSGMSSTSLGASLLRMVKCVFHSCVCSSTLVITTPSASFIGMSQFFKTSSQRFSYLIQCSHILHLCCRFCLVR